MTARVINPYPQFRLQHGLRGWDHFFLSEAFFVSGKSKDRSTKCGCVICTPTNDKIVEGWNGFPRRINDLVEARHQRPAKYLWTEHAERNAIYNAGRLGVPVAGGIIYQTAAPCPDCARAIIQSGISKMVTVLGESEHEWAERFNITTSMEMLHEAGVSVTLYDPACLPSLLKYRYEAA